MKSGEIVKKTLRVAVMACAGMVAVNGFAETVSQKQAASLAQAFFNEAAGRMTPKPKMVWNGKRLTTDRLFSPFYVYNAPAGGFVMISAENKAFPILAYSLKGSFDPDHLSDDEKAFFADYARDIEHIRYVADVPVEAIKAWGDFPSYVRSILDAHYDATDPRETPERVAEEVEAMLESPRADLLASDLYTQPQWQQVINDDLASGRDVNIGILSDRRVAPAVIHGRKGDYYRIRFDRPNDWLLRINASEIYSGWQIADIQNPVEIPEVPEEEPFRFYEEFEETVRKEREMQALAIEEILTPTIPLVKSIGGGRFEIDFPEEINLAMVYNVSGSLVDRRTFRDTNVGHIDLAIQLGGFYVAMFRGVSGKQYSFKLYR